MTERIINCYELDIKQDIPVEMEIMRSSNEKLENSNQAFKIILISIGFAIVLFAVYQRSKAKKEDDNKF